ARGEDEGRAGRAEGRGGEGGQAALLRAAGLVRPVPPRTGRVPVARRAGRGRRGGVPRGPAPRARQRVVAARAGAEPGGAGEEGGCREGEGAVRGGVEARRREDPVVVLLRGGVKCREARETQTTQGTQ